MEGATLNKRFEDWPERLGAFFAERADRAFAWGGNDCCLFVCDAVLAMTDLDMAADLRGAYATEIGAASSMIAYLRNTWNVAELPEPGKLLEEFASKMAAEHAFPEVPPAFAQRGDVVLFDGGSGLTLGLVAMSGTRAVSVGPAGAVEVPIAECVKAWRIG
jgi:hypothetical protein